MCQNYSLGSRQLFYKSICDIVDILPIHVMVMMMEMIIMTMMMPLQPPTPSIDTLLSRRVIQQCRVYCRQKTLLLLIFWLFHSAQKQSMCCMMMMMTHDDSVDSWWWWWHRMMLSTNVVSGHKKWCIAPYLLRQLNTKDAGDENKTKTFFFSPINGPSSSSSSPWDAPLLPPTLLPPALLPLG